MLPIIHVFPLPEYSSYNFLKHSISLSCLCLPPRLKIVLSAKKVKFISRKVTGYTVKFWQMQLYIEIHTSVF